jgi:uncharacterized protein with HEPN domain
MSNIQDIAKLKFIRKMIADIGIIIERHGGIPQALQDEEEGQLAIFMCLAQIGESLNKLKSDEVRSEFSADDIKGSYDVRMFITHNYPGVNLKIIERIIVEKIPLFKTITDRLLKKYSNSF